MAMTEKELLIWAAGVVEGAGVVAVHIVQGPMKIYPALSLLVPLSDSSQIRRMTIAAGNGNVSKTPTGFELSGYAAVRGFVEQLWPYLTVAKRREINMEMKRLKLMKAGKI